MVATQSALKQNVSRATAVGRRRFPAREAELIAGIVQRDLPFYDAKIREASITAVNAFARHMDLLADDVRYDRIVATELSRVWDNRQR